MELARPDRRRRRRTIRPNRSARLIRFIHAATRPSISLDATRDTGANFSLLQTISDPEGDRAEKVNTDETIVRLFEVLRPREQQVLTFRFGLGGGERLSLSQVGRLLEVSKERVRQIEDRALEKLEPAPGSRIWSSSSPGPIRQAEAGSRNIRGRRNSSQARRLAGRFLLMEEASRSISRRVTIRMAATPLRPSRDVDPVGPFLHYLMAECGVSSNTLAAYRSDLMGFIRWRRVATPGPLAKLDVSALSQYVESLTQSGLAPSSVCRHIASLSTFFRYLVFEGRLTDNVVKLLIAPAVWDRLPTVLGPAAVVRLLDAPNPETRLGRRDRAVLETLYATGCRASEVAGLRPADLDLKVGLIRCVGKGNKERRVPLGSRAISALEDLSPSRSPQAGGSQPGDSQCVRLEVGQADDPDRDLVDRQTLCPRGGTARRRQPPHPQAQLRDPSPRRRRRSPRRPGDPRPRLDLHDPDLHPGRAEPPA